MEILLELEIDMFNTIKEGQIWSYKTRRNEEDSTLIVLKFEELNGVAIVHIKLEGLKLKAKSKKDIILSIDHLPISLKSFENSVISLKGTCKTGLNDGYFYWRHKFESGESGIWSIEIAEIISLTENSME
jgi:hypothetical protein